MNILTHELSAYKRTIISYYPIEVYEDMHFIEIIHMTRYYKLEIASLENLAFDLLD